MSWNDRIRKNKIAQMTQKIMDDVWGYVRWSEEEQGEGFTKEFQIKAIQHYILMKNWIFDEDKIIVDEGWSGSDHERPGLKRLQYLAEKGKVKAVVVYRLDRLSRSYVNMVDLVFNDWDKRGIIVCSASEGLESNSEVGKMLFGIMTTFAERERELIKERTLDGKISMAENGFYQGGTAPYGYRFINDLSEIPFEMRKKIGDRKRKTGIVVVNDEEAKIVRDIFDKAAKGWGCVKIADYLNNFCATRNGKPWRDYTIRNIITNPFYAGYITWGKYSYKKRHGKLVEMVKNEIHIKNKGIHESIISEETFAKVAGILEANRVNKTKSWHSQFVLTGSIYCGKCGERMSGTLPKETCPQYRCNSYKLGANNRCGTSAVNATHLHSYIFKACKKVYGQIIDYTSVENFVFTEKLNAINSAKNEIKNLTNSLKSEEMFLEKCRDDYKNGVISGSTYEQFKIDTLKRLKELTEKIDGLTSYAKKLESDISRDRMVNVALYNKLKDIEKLDPATQRKILQLVLKKVTVLRDRGDNNVYINLEWNDTLSKTFGNKISTEFTYCPDFDRSKVMKEKEVGKKSNETRLRNNGYLQIDGRQLQQLREKANLTRRDLAQMLIDSGIITNKSIDKVRISIWKYETGRHTHMSEKTYDWLLDRLQA